MSELGPPIVPDTSPFSILSEAETLLEIVAQLGAALMLLKASDNPTVIEHVRTAHRLALDLYGKSDGSASFRGERENAT